MDYFLPNRGLLLDKIVLKNPKLAEDFLNLHVNTIGLGSSTLDLSELSCNDGEPCLDINLSPFNKPQNMDSCHESLSTYTMLKERHEDLIKHPVTETFIHLKWQQIRWLFYLSLFLHILSATITTIAILKSFTVAPDNFKNSHQNTIVYLFWAMAAAHVPVFVMLVLEIFQKRSSFFISFWWPIQTQLFRKNRKIIHFPLPSLTAFLRISIPSLMIAFITTRLIEPKNNLLHTTHLSAWLLLISWADVIMKVEECPYLGIYVYMLSRVLKDVLIFLFSMMSLVIGFGSAFLVLFPSIQDFRTAIYCTLAMLAGDFKFKGLNNYLGNNKNIDIPGTTEAIFVVAFLVLSIGMLNILIGLTISNVKEVLLCLEDFRVSKMITNSFGIEDTFHFISTVFSKFGCGKNVITKPVKLMKDETSTLFRLTSQSFRRYNNEKPSLLHPEFGKQQCQTFVPVYKARNEASKFMSSVFYIPRRILESAQRVLGNYT